MVAHRQSDQQETTLDNAESRALTLKSTPEGRQPESRPEGFSGILPDRQWHSNPLAIFHERQDTAGSHLPLLETQERDTGRFDRFSSGPQLLAASLSLVDGTRTREDGDSALSRLGIRSRPCARAARQTRGSSSGITSLADMLARMRRGPEPSVAAESPVQAGPLVNQAVVDDMVRLLGTVYSKADSSQQYEQDSLPATGNVPGSVAGSKGGSRSHNGDADDIDLFVGTGETGGMLESHGSKSGGGTSDGMNPEGRKLEVRSLDESPPEAAGDKSNLPGEVEIAYPDGKGSLHAKRDDAGRLVAFTLKDEAGQWSYHVNEAGQWLKTGDDGVECQVNGSFELTGGGQLWYRKPNGEVDIHKTDGSLAKARQLPDGAVVVLNDSGKQAIALYRKDGSQVEAAYKKNRLTNIIETDKTGLERTTWTKDNKGVWHGQSQSKGKDGKWVSNGKPSEERRDIKFSTNGKYTFTDSLNFKHALDADGSEKIEPRVTANEDGTKTVEIQYPEGKGFLTVKLDKDNTVTEFTKDDGENKTTCVKEQGHWYMLAGSRKIKINGDFTLALTNKGEFKCGDFVQKDGNRYDLARLDGSIIHEKINNNASCIRYNDDNTISVLTRKDGSTVAVACADGQQALIIDTNKDETARTVWIKDQDIWVSQVQTSEVDGQWTTDESKKQEERKSIEITEQGLTIATDQYGFKHVTGADGRHLNEGPGGSKFTFDDKGRIASITAGNGANRQYKFHYDDQDNIAGVEVCDGKGNLLQTRTKVGDMLWKNTNADGSPVRNPDGSDNSFWQGEIKLSPQGNLMQRNLSNRAAGLWYVITPDNEKYHEKVSADGKHILRAFGDKTLVASELMPDGEERVIRMTRGKESRMFQYDADGKLIAVTDTTSKGMASWRPEGDNVKVDANGDVVFELENGTRIVRRHDFSTVEFDGDGDIRRAVTKEGKSRFFEYQEIGGQKQLVRFTDTRLTRQGQRSEVWQRRINADGSVTDQYVCLRPDGRAKMRFGVVVLPSGDYKYRDHTGRQRLARVGRSGDLDSFSDNVDDARDRLMENMESYLDEPRRLRLQQMMERFEKRAICRVEAQTAGGMNYDLAHIDWDRKVSQTYDYLSRMLDISAPNPTYDLPTRSKLVENAVFAMAWPAKADDQGNWGCCWQICGVYAGLTQHPDKMARMLTELSVNGTFTDTNNRTWTPPRSLLEFTSQGGNWTIENCGNGRRSPCSEIWTSVAAYLSRDGKRMDRGAHGGSMEGMNHSMKMITGDTFTGIWGGGHAAERKMTSREYQRELLMKGAVILGNGGHMWYGGLDRVNGQWMLLSSLQHGDSGRHVNAVLTDLRAWDIQETNGRYVPDYPPSMPKIHDGGVGISPRRPDRRPRSPDRLVPRIFHPDDDSYYRAAANDHDYNRDYYHDYYWNYYRNYRTDASSNLPYQFPPGFIKPGYHPVDIDDIDPHGPGPSYPRPPVTPQPVPVIGPPQPDPGEDDYPDSGIFRRKGLVLNFLRSRLRRRFL